MSHQRFIIISKAMGFTTGESSEVADSILGTFIQRLNAMGIMYRIAWLMNALTILTSIPGPLKDWTDWSASQMDAQMAVRSERQLTCTKTHR